jgi:hypothetical protein
MKNLNKLLRNWKYITKFPNFNLNILILSNYFQNFVNSIHYLIRLVNNYYFLTLHLHHRLVLHYEFHVPHLHSISTVIVFINLAEFKSSLHYFYYWLLLFIMGFFLFHLGQLILSFNSQISKNQNLVFT